jgi:hypothetical protein
MNLKLKKFDSEQNTHPSLNIYVVYNKLVSVKMN